MDILRKEYCTRRGRALEAFRTGAKSRGRPVTSDRPPPRRCGQAAWPPHFCYRVAESKSGEALETPYSAALSFATALVFLQRVGVLCCVVVGGDRTPEPPFSAALGLAAALGFLLRVGVLCCVVVGEDQ